VTLAFILALIFVFSGTASAKSLYVIADHHTGQFDAYNINPNGTITYQATYNVNFNDPAGIAIHNEDNVIFITSEFNAGVEIVDASTYTYIGTASGPSNLAGIDVDEKNDVVYTVGRNTNQIYAYDWNAVTKTLTLKSGYPKALPNCSAAYGIAYDDKNGLLYVTDATAGFVRVYDVNTWNEVSRFKPSHHPIGIAIDTVRGYVYTVSLDGHCAWVPGSAGSTLLSKYDLSTGTETTIDMGHGGVDVAVDEITGYVYVTGGCSGDNLEIWDTSTTPWTKIQDTGVIGNPAGLAIAQIGIEMLKLNKTDHVKELCCRPNKIVTYDICFSNPNNFTVTNVTLVDDLPSSAVFVSASNGGVYDPVKHTVKWHIRSLPPKSPMICYQISVNYSNVKLCTNMTNFVTIKSDQTPPETRHDTDHICCITPGPCVPEFPPLAVGVLGLLAGAVLVLRRR